MSAFRKFVELEKVLKPEGQTTWKGSTGLEGERPDEKFEIIRVCTRSSMHVCRSDTPWNIAKNSSGLPISFGNSTSIRWTICTVLCCFCCHCFAGASWGLMPKVEIYVSCVNQLVLGGSCIDIPISFCFFCCLVESEWYSLQRSFSRCSNVGPSRPSTGWSWK